MNLRQSPVVRAIIRARELILGTKPTEHARRRALLDEMRLVKIVRGVIHNIERPEYTTVYAQLIERAQGTGKPVKEVQNGNQATLRPQ